MYKKNFQKSKDTEKISPPKNDSTSPLFTSIIAESPSGGQLFGLLIDLIADRRLTESIELIEKAGYHDSLTISFILCALQYEVAV